jgi:hypothetical protein
MDAHEALFVALVALAMAADFVKKHLVWDQLPTQIPLEAWALQPPCQDIFAAMGCVLALGG